MLGVANVTHENNLVVQEVKMQLETLKNSDKSRYNCIVHKILGFTYILCVNIALHIS